MKLEGEENTSDLQRVDFPDNPFRHTVVILLREKLEKNEETEQLIDWIEAMWDTIDTVIHRFGEEEAEKIIHARLGIQSLVGGSQ